jgi:hypothetical protein
MEYLANRDVSYASLAALGELGFHCADLPPSIGITCPAI